jgi:membrane-bound lytic murein transglycosylase D
VRLLLVLLISFSSFAWEPPGPYESIRLRLEEFTLNESLKLKFRIAENTISNETISKILSDSENRVHNDFQIPKYFKYSTTFWFSIYTQYSTKQIVIHDKEHLGIIYKAIDFTELHSSKINRFAKEKLQVSLSLQHSKAIKDTLKSLGTRWTHFNPDQQSIVDAIKASGTKIPGRKSKRIKFFTKLANNVRIQTGQRDMIHQGILRSFIYEDFFKQQLKLFNLPKELLAIPFLESSFNAKAVSKAGAAGMWQFMEYIGNLMMPKMSKEVDYRFNPVVSTIAAFHLLKENKMILKYWDLAITAYNSGTKHLLRARKRYKKKGRKVDLAFILRNYKHPHLGFASKNFYSEFLALTYVLAYKNKIFPIEGYRDKNTPFNDHLKVFLTKCSLRPSWFMGILKKSSPNIYKLNTHFLKPKTKLKKGAIVVTDMELNPKRYFEITQTEMRKIRPRKWPNLVRSKYCN